MRKGKGRNSGLLPSSLRIISSCLKTVSSNASTVASSVRSSFAASSEDLKDQVTWAGFDRLQLGQFIFKRVLLLGYQNGFQVLDVEDASNFSELVSKRDGPVSFLQMQPFPEMSDGQEGFRSSHPLLLVVAGDDTNTSCVGQNHAHLGGVGRDININSQLGNCVSSPTSVRLYSLRSHCYVHVLRFRSAVHMVRCSPRIVAVGLATQIYCVDALTLENKFSVLTYPVPHLSGQGTVVINMGYGPMAVGHRWLAYASNNPLVSNTSRLSPQNLTPSPGASPSTSPGGTSLVARYAMDQLAAGIINLGDMGYKTLSRYYQELLPDGSNSPVSSTSGWKIGRPAGTDMECAGTVTVTDFVSRTVITQFKAHTSPLSALCFDPSGTLLVTASVYGNNINVFRIMPSCAENVAGLRNYDWTSSHVHLYKLHRGMTSAMIQDVCFSHYSQWIAIVSSKGTCHIFFLSPFGGDPGFQSCKNVGEEPSLHPLLTLPWWYTSASVNNQHSSLPPPPVSLSVVSRIKYSSFGWINTTVGHANAVAAGKVFVPSGAVAAVFHDSTSQSVQQGNSGANALEHLLVYTPSGHVVQHELLPSIGAEAGDSARAHSASFVHIQEDDLKVKVEPVQWWDVCRRSDWPEREECVSGYEETHSALEVANCEDNFIMDFADTSEEFIGKKSMKPCNVKSHERCHFFLSNAEVQISTDRLPIWQKPKVYFYAMHSVQVHSSNNGELEIENVPFQEIEIRQKELLPIFDHFRSNKTCWNERGLSGGSCSRQSSLESHQIEGKVVQETIICHSKPASLSSTGSSECGSSRRFEHLLDLDPINSEKPCNATCQTRDDFYQGRIGCIGERIDGQCAILNKISLIDGASASSHQHAREVNPHYNQNIDNDLHFSHSLSPMVVRTVAGECMTTNSKESNDIHGSNAESGELYTKIFLGATALLPADNRNDLVRSSSEADCKALDIDEAHELLGVAVAQVDKNDSPCERKNPVEDGEDDEFLGGMFAFSEEG